MGNFLGLGLAFTALDKGLEKAVQKMSRGIDSMSSSLRDLERTAKEGRLAETFKSWNDDGLSKVKGGMDSIIGSLEQAAHEGQLLYRDFQKGSTIAGAQAALNTKQLDAMKNAVVGVGVSTGASFDTVQDTFNELLKTGKGFKETVDGLGDSVKMMRTFGLQPSQIASFETAKKTLGLTDKAMDGLIDQTLAAQKAFGNIPISLDELPKTLVHVKDKLSFMKVFQGDTVKAAQSTINLGMAFTKGLGVPFEEGKAQADEFFDSMAEENKGLSQAYAGISDDIGDLTGNLAVAFRSVGTGMKKVRTGAMDPTRFFADMAKTVGEASEGVNKLGAGEMARFRTFFEKSFGAKSTQLVFEHWKDLSGVLGKDLPAALAKSGGEMESQKKTFAGTSAAAHERMEQTLNAMKMGLGGQLDRLELKFFPLLSRGLKTLSGVMKQITAKGGPADKFFGFLDRVFPKSGDINIKPIAEAFESTKTMALSWFNSVDWDALARKGISGLIKALKTEVKALGGSKSLGLDLGALLIASSGARSIAGGLLKGGIGLAGRGAMKAGGAGIGLLGKLLGGGKAAGGMGGEAEDEAMSVASAGLKSFGGSLVDGTKGMAGWLMQQKDVKFVVDGLTGSMKSAAGVASDLGSGALDKLGSGLVSLKDRVLDAASNAFPKLSYVAKQSGDMLSNAAGRIASNFKAVSSSLVGKGALLAASFTAGAAIGTFARHLVVGGKSIDDWTQLAMDKISELWTSMGRGFNKLLNKIGLGTTAEERVQKEGVTSKSLLSALHGATSTDVGMKAKSLSTLKAFARNSDVEDLAEVASNAGFDKATAASLLAQGNGGGVPAPSAAAKTNTNFLNLAASAFGDGTATPSPETTGGAAGGVPEVSTAGAADITAAIRAMQDQLAKAIAQLNQRPIVIQVQAGDLAKALKYKQLQSHSAKFGT